MFSDHSDNDDDDDSSDIEWDFSDPLENLTADSIRLHSEMRDDLWTGAYRSFFHNQAGLLLFFSCTYNKQPYIVLPKRRLSHFKCFMKLIKTKAAVQRTYCHDP